MKAPPKTLPLLLEIGCEEIPARFLTQGQADLGTHLEAALGEARLLPEETGPKGSKSAAGGPPGQFEGIRPDPSGQATVQTFSTPRRLVAWAPKVLEKQSDTVEEVLGPPARVGLDPAGKYTKAAESFAAKNSARLDELAVITTPKGEYLALRRATWGRPAQAVLPQLLSSVVSSLTFPKSMYWTGKSGLRFARPIRWILALLGEGKQAQTISVEVEGINAGNTTFGHRISNPSPVRVQSFKEYGKELRARQVEVVPEERRRRIRAEIKVILEGLDCLPVDDKGLEDWAVNSTEWPCALLGRFEERFLKLPREILVTVMRDHQKHFAVQNREGTLQPRFIAVLDREGDPKDWIRQGHERVLAARFADAEFFWDADQRLAMRDRQELLRTIIYQRELGSYAEKVRRTRAIAEDIAGILQAAGKLAPQEAEHVLKAVDLAKCDLTTEMVKEFPELQGIVGGLYARAQGEAEEVAAAIYDHYLPESMEDRTPSTVIGAVVSLADKIASVVGGFVVGREPTGSSDPYALRRQANGVIKVLLEHSLPIRLKDVVGNAVSSLDISWQRPREEVFKAIIEFFEERLRYDFESWRKLRYDTVRAVLASGWNVPADALRRAQALESIRASEDVEALCQAARRIRNLLAKSATAEDWRPGEVDEGALSEPAERALYQAHQLAASSAGQAAEQGQYRQALEIIAGLRPAVDEFFDRVLVMAEDSKLRENRLRLLGKLDQLFSSIAHFAEITSPAENVDASTSQAVDREA